MKRFAMLLLFIFGTSCVHDGSDVSQTPMQKARSRRAMSSRKFDTQDKKEMLAASAGVLQDLGYIIEESEERLGLIVGRKDRTAMDTQDILLSSFLAIAVSLATESYQQPVYDDKQQIYASLIVRPVKKNMLVRVTFFRKVWRTDGYLRTELMEDATMYQKFFGKLSKSLFLEGHKI